MRRFAKAGVIIALGAGIAVAIPGVRERGTLLLRKVQRPISPLWIATTPSWLKARLLTHPMFTTMKRSSSRSSAMSISCGRMRPIRSKRRTNESVLVDWCTMHPGCPTRSARLVRVLPVIWFSAGPPRPASKLPMAQFPRGASILATCWPRSLPRRKADPEL